MAYPLVALSRALPSQPTLVQPAAPGWIRRWLLPVFHRAASSCSLSDLLGRRRIHAACQALLRMPGSPTCPFHRVSTGYYNINGASSQTESRILKKKDSRVCPAVHVICVCPDGYSSPQSLRSLCHFMSMSSWISFKRSAFSGLKRCLKRSWVFRNSVTGSFSLGL